MTVEWPSATVVAADRRIVFCDLDNERVLLDLASSRYYALNKVGAHVWEVIANPTSVGKLHESLLEKFEVEPERCQQDLEALLSNLAQLTLIDVQHAPLD